MMAALKRIADFLASFQLSVAILFLMGLVTFFGTTYQVEHGLLQAQQEYFYSWVIGHRWKGLVFPLPGGQLLMATLAVNMLFGGLWRIRKSWRTAGVIVVHLGIVGLLLSSLVKYYHSTYGYMKLYAGDTSNEYVHYYDWEVAIHDAFQSEGVQEWLIPDDDFLHLTGDRSRVFETDDLPFKLKLERFERNCRPVKAGSGQSYAHPVVDGYTLRPDERLPEEGGNVAGLYLTATDTTTGVQTQGILYGLEWYPLVIEAGGRRWAIRLRKQRFEVPFQVQLDEFVKKDYARTRKVLDFSSYVTVNHQGEETAHHIKMNEPLRRDGLVFFQASWGPQGARPGDALFTSLEVHDNPSDKWPEYSCWVILAGMLLAFSYRLVQWVEKSIQRRQKALEAQES